MRALVCLLASASGRAAALCSCERLIPPSVLHACQLSLPSLCLPAGYRQKEVVGRGHSFLQGPDTDPVTLAEIEEALREG